ncbi:MAG: phenylalanine--tRNA ligase subunit beta [Candidatus Altiarchaeota archaeon]
MPSVEYDMGDLNHLLGKRYEPDYLKQAIPMMGVDLERLDEEKIVLEVFPNRPDMLSIEGFARALKGFLQIESGYKAYAAEPSGVEVLIDPSVDDVRPNVAAGIVSGVEMDDYTVKSIMGMQEKLHLTHGRNRAKVAIGVHDLDKVKPPFTYKAVDPKSATFVPLDTDERMSLYQIILKHPKGKDYAWTLDGKKKYPLFVDCMGEVLSFPPIINGELTKLTEYTRNLFVEMTGTSQQAVDTALNIMVTSLADRGGKIQTVQMRRK